MQKIITIKCPKCNNNHHFHKFGKDKFGNQKYRCLVCNHRFAQDNPVKTVMKKYPPCPMCGKSSFLHHDYRDYSNYCCSDKRCNHSFFCSKVNGSFGKKHYIWFIIDSETRFVLELHLSPYRNSPQAHFLFSHVAHMGSPACVVSDRYNAYKVPVKCYFPDAAHIRVQSVKDDISNNLIESFNNRSKAWYKTKHGLHSLEVVNATISVFVFS